MRFYIMGCQRSGTNLARLILDSHPHIWTFSENTSYALLDNNIEDELAKRKSIGIYYLDRNFDFPVFIDKEAKWFGYTVPGWTELLTEYSCVREKTSNGKIIFMLRHPLQVVASMFRTNHVKTTIANMKLWLSDPCRKLKDFEKELDYNKEEDEKYQVTRWLTVYWKYKNRVYLELPKNQVLGVKYDLLVTKPKHVIEKIINFLDLEWYDDLMQHHKKNHYETHGGMTIGNSRSDRAIDCQSQNLWKDILDTTQINIIVKHSEELLDKLNL